MLSSTCSSLAFSAASLSSACPYQFVSGTPSGYLGVGNRGGPREQGWLEGGAMETFHDLVFVNHVRGAARHHDRLEAVERM